MDFEEYMGGRMLIVGCVDAYNEDLRRLQDESMGVIIRASGRQLGRAVGTWGVY